MDGFDGKALLGTKKLIEIEWARHTIVLSKIVEMVFSKMTFISVWHNHCISQKTIGYAMDCNGV